MIHFRRVYISSSNLKGEENDKILVEVCVTHAPTSIINLTISKQSVKQNLLKLPSLSILAFSIPVTTNDGLFLYEEIRYIVIKHICFVSNMTRNCIYSVIFV